MKKALSAFLIVLATTALSLLLGDSIFAHTSASALQSILIGNLISIALAIWIFDHAPSTHPDYMMSFGSIILAKSLDDLTRNIEKDATPVAPKGLVKKGDKLSPEHRAKISASLKKRSAEKKSQKKSGK